jgi:putative membrane protein
MSNIAKNAVVALKGFAMGAANVIPGVSGGTIALLTGIFNELIEALNAVLSPSSWKLVLQGKFKEFWKTIHGTFLIWLAAGVLVSVFSLARVMEYVLAYHPIQTWAFFFGLIIVSAVYMLHDIKKWKFSDCIWLLFGIVLGAVICLLSPTQTTDATWFILVCGAIAICTMILPGISGSFILVLLGKYEFIMRALSELNWPVLFMFAIGCVLGLAAFSKFLHWLIGHYERPTLITLIGFTLGSLVKVWPWSDKVSLLTAQLMRGGQTAEQAEAGVKALTGTGMNLSSIILPQTASAIIWMAIGAVLVIVLEWLGHRNQKKD